MNDKLMEQILPLVKATKEGILAGIEMLKQQVPDLIQQIYAWNFTVSIIWFLVGVFLLIFGLCFINMAKRDSDASQGTSWLVVAIPLILGFIFMSCNYTWIKIMVAPKLFLIEYIGQFIK